MIKEQEGDVELAISIAKETCQVYEQTSVCSSMKYMVAQSPCALSQVASSYRAVSDKLDATKILKDKIAPFWVAMVKV